MIVAARLRPKRAQHLLWRPDHGAEQDVIWPCQPQKKKKKKRWSWNNLGRETIEFFISWHRNEWIFIPNAKQALNPRTINGETSIPGTIMGFLCAFTVKTAPWGFKETWASFLFLSKTKWRENKHFLQLWMPRISPYPIPTLTPIQGALILSGLKQRSTASDLEVEWEAFWALL